MSANKIAAYAQFDSVHIGGGTNFMAGFSKAFEVLGASVEQEYTASCHKAILFLTDGQNTEGTPAEVLSATDKLPAQPERSPSLPNRTLR